MSPLFGRSRFPTSTGPDAPESLGHPSSAPRAATPRSSEAARINEPKRREPELVRSVIILHPPSKASGTDGLTPSLFTNCAARADRAKPRASGAIDRTRPRHLAQAVPESGALILR